MKLVSKQTGQLEDVPDAEVSKVYLAGTHGFESPDTPVPIKLADGRLGTVPASKAHSAFQSGAVAAPTEVQKAQDEAKYGGIGGTLAAGGEGLARGATVGLSDPLAIGAAGLFGGKGAAEATRTHLAKEKETNPIVSAGAEIAGAAAPVLLSGGTAAPEVGAGLAVGEVAAGGAEAAQGASKVATLAKILGAPARGVAAVGESAGRAAEAVMGAPGAGGALSRIARVAAKAGATGAAEGGLFGAGNEISEDALGDHQLNAEKLIAAMGHGALYGSMVGGGLGVAGGAATELAGSVINKIGPSLERQADVEAFKALHPKLGVTKEVMARAGGEAEVGATARKYGILGDTIAEATAGPEEVLARTKAAQAKVGAEIESKLAAAGEAQASAKASELIAPLEKQVAVLESTAAGSQKAGPLKDYLEKIKASLGVTSTVKPNSSEEVKAWLKANPGKFTEKGGLPPEAFQKTVVSDPDVPLAQLTAERRALQENVYGQAKSLAPPLHIDELRKFSASLSQAEQDAMDKATGKGGAELKALNKDYQRLKLIEKATQDRVATQGTNQRLSLTDKMFAGAHAAGAIASGHPIGALGAMATAGVSKAVREKGNAVASLALGRLAKLDLIARASESVDDGIEKAVSAFTKEGPPVKVRLRHFGATTKQETVEDRYKRTVESVPRAPAPNLRTEHLETALPGLAQHAPKTALAVSNTIAASSNFLATREPKVGGAPNPLGRQPRPDPAAMSKHIRETNAVNDPVATVKNGLETGKLHTDEVNAIAAAYPTLYQQVIQPAAIKAASQKGLGYAKLMTLSKLAKMPLDNSLTPQSVQFFQGTYMQPTGAPHAGGPAKPARRVSSPAPGHDPSALGVGNL